MSYIGQNPVFGDFPYQTLIGDGTASYTLNFNVSNENGLLVFLNGAIQVPGENYTAGGTSLQFADNVPIGTQIFAYGMGLPKSMLSTSAGAIGLNELAAGVYANAAEARSFINDTKVITPKTLADAFTGSNQSLTANGYQKLPGGLIIQWGLGTSGPSGVVTTLYPIAFPNSTLRVLASASGSYVAGIGTGNNSSPNITIYKSDTTIGTSGINVNYLAIGF